MKIQKFEDIIAWQKGHDFAIEIYGKFGESRDFGFRDQICRAAVSISNNIAEGFDRSSNAEFRRFLFIPSGSCSECKSMLYLAERLDYLSKEIANDLRNKSSEISKIITGLIKSLN
ncbi:MAG: four helix bundle protein [Cytophagales bacterium]|nr:four helix bundle protein [Cytophagales bacterium]